MESESDNKINFLDVTIMKPNDKLTLNVYIKPTTTDSITANDSCHPTVHKLAAVRYLTNRMKLYNLSTTNKEKERRIVKQNNKNDVSALNFPSKLRNKNKPTGSKWAKFFYICKETKYITKLFKDSSVNVTFTTRNTINNLLSIKPRTYQNKFENSGVYQQTFPNCKMEYVG